MSGHGGWLDRARLVKAPLIPVNGAPSPTAPTLHLVLNLDALLVLVGILATGLSQLHDTLPAARTGKQFLDHLLDYLLVQPAWEFKIQVPDVVRAEWIHWRQQTTLPLTPLETPCADEPHSES